MPSIKVSLLNGASLLKVLSGSFIIRISSTVFGFINSVLLARFLGVEDYGIYVFALSIVALLSTPTQFGMPTLVVREFAAFQAKNQWDLIKGLALRSNQFVCILSFLICTIAVIWLCINPLKYPPYKQEALLFSLLLVPVLSLSALRDAMLRGFRHVILAQLSEGFIRPLLFMLVLLLGIFVARVDGSLWLAISYYFICSLVVFIIGWLFFFRIKPHQFRIYDKRFDTKKWFLAALPIGLTGGMQVLNLQLSTVLLGLFNSDADVALYRVAALVAGVVVIILQVVNSVVAPYFSRLYAQQDIKGIEKLVAKTNKVLFLATLPIIICIISISPWMLNVFYGDEFIAAYLPLVILTIGQGVNSLMGSVALLLNMTGHQSDVAKAMLASLLINIVLHISLLPSFGLLGAAFATTIMVIIWNILLWIKVRQRLGIRYFL